MIKILFDKKYTFDPSLRLYHQMQSVGIVDHVKKFISKNTNPGTITSNIINYLRIIISNEVEIKTRVNFDDIYKVAPGDQRTIALHERVTEQPSKSPQTYYEINADIVRYLYIFNKLNVFDDVIKTLVEYNHKVLVTGLFDYNHEVDKIEIDPSKFEAQWKYIREYYYQKI